MIMLDLHELEETFARLTVPWVMRRSDLTSNRDPLLARVPQDGFYTWLPGSANRDRACQRRAQAAYRSRNRYRIRIRERARYERKKGMKGMTQIEAYDALVPLVGEPAIFQFREGEQRFVLGRWVEGSTDLDPNKHVLLGKPKAVLVLGRGDSWEEALERAHAALGARSTSGGKP